MATISVQDELFSTLLEQSFFDAEHREILLSKYNQLAKSYVDIDNSIAVLSDFQYNRSYIYAGSFGDIFGLPSHCISIDSAFEECIFSKIHPDDLTERHILELRYFQFQKNLPQEERHKYNTFSYIRVCNAMGKYQYITHRTFYLTSLPNGSIWLALCLYAPSMEQHSRQGIDGKIINNETGEILSVERYKQYDCTLLSSRELEVLTLVAQGKGSKLIADQLNIALYTVHRHRQNIIKKMHVTNATEAVQTALIMGLIAV